MDLRRRFFRKWWRFLDLIGREGDFWRESDDEFYSHCKHCGGMKRLQMPRCEDCDRELGLGG